MDSLHPRLRTHVPTGVRSSVEALATAFRYKAPIPREEQRFR